MQQSLGGNAANVQAGAAIGRALFDDSDLETELCSLDGANITAGAGTDNNYIISHLISFIVGQLSAAAHIQ
jgi:hypothetical protein